MLIKDCEKLIDYLQSMMNDGVQLVQGGNVLSWEDTQIPDMLEQIKQNAKDEMWGYARE